MTPIYNLPFSRAFLIFIIFGCIGWISEVIYVGLFVEHKLVNRGFLHGPICPVYGFGGVVILLLPPQLYPTWVPLFFASMVLCTIVEYFVSWILEKMFHTLWWDYSNLKFNLNGRICLLNSVLFGFMGVGVFHFVLPHIFDFLDWLGDVRIKYITDVIGLVLSTDIIITVKRLVDFNTTMEKLKEFTENLREHYGQEAWFKGETLSEMILSIKEHASVETEKFSESFLTKLEEMQSRHPNVESFVKRFPTLKSKKYHEGIVLVRKHIKENIKERIKK